MLQVAGGSYLFIYLFIYLFLLVFFLFLRHLEKVLHVCEPIFFIVKGFLDIPYSGVFRGVIWNKCTKPSEC